MARHSRRQRDADGQPADHAWVVRKPMYLHYSGDASASIPTAAGLAANLNADTDTLILGGGYTWEQTLLGGAHYSVFAFLPYTWLDISGDVATPGGPFARDSKVDGFGDMTIVPVMLSWKSEVWQYDFLMPVYAPTGSYQLGRLGNPGLNYWTFDPTFGVAYLDKQSGFNAMLHVGYGMNTENPDTHYKTGSILHVDASIEQLVPAGSGFVALGAEAFYFDQMTCDTGSGATLGCFKGRTAGVGPVLGYIQPLGQQALSLEVKWLPEFDTRNRLSGDYVWLKMVYKF